MTTSTRPRTQTCFYEVVAGVANDGSAAAVAAAAIDLAYDLGARVRFVQVLPVSLSGDARAEVSAAMFTTVLRALHGRPRVRVTFESPAGDPARVLVARSRKAVHLVVGEDQHHLDGDGSVAAHCLARAACGVTIVPVVRMQSLSRSGTLDPTGQTTPDRC